MRARALPVGDNVFSSVDNFAHAVDCNACVHSSTNGIPISSKVLPMVPLVIPLVTMVMPMVPLTNDANGTIGNTFGNNGNANGTICKITIGTIGRTPNRAIDID